MFESIGEVLQGIDAGLMVDAELPTAIEALELIIRQAQAAQLRVLREFDGSGAAVAAGGRSTASWLRGRLSLSTGEAKARVLDARSLDRLPTLAAALSRGETSVPHLRAARIGTEKLPDDVMAAAEPEIARVATEHSPRTVIQLTDQLRHRYAPEDEAEAAQARRDRRGLDVAETFDGMVSIHGWLDRDEGAPLLAAMAATRKSGPEDVRTPTQRRADLLIEMASFFLQHRQTPTEGGERPHVNVLVGLDTLREEPGSGAAVTPTGSTMSDAAALRWSCDSTVTRIVIAGSAADAVLPPPLGGRTEVLDVGRATRVVSTALRKACGVRDRGCVFPGCDAPPSRCDVHHLIHWARGGGTDLNNVAMVCGYHHGYIHDHDLLLVHCEDGSWDVVAPTPNIHDVRHPLTAYPLLIPSRCDHGRTAEDFRLRDRGDDGMNIQDAVRSVLSQYIGFSGRARRSEYWYWVLAAGVIGVILFVLGLAAKIFLVVYYLYVLALLLPNIGVLMRRLHDTGRSGWWIFISLVPFVGAIVLIVFACQDSTPGDNQYGPSPKYSG